MDSPHPRSYVVLSCDIELDVMRTAIILTETHRAHGRNMFFHDKWGVPPGRFGVKWGSNWGQTGAVRGLFQRAGLGIFRFAR